jgi:hypothetical protein
VNKRRFWVPAFLALGLGAAALVFVSVPGLAGGFTGADAPSRIPIPAREFSAIFEDVGGTTVQATRVTLNGEVFVYGRYGSGQVTVPFEKIKEVRVERTSDPLKRMIVVQLLDGSDPVKVEVEDDVPWYAATRFGNYKVEVRDLRAVRGFRTP